MTDRTMECILRVAETRSIARAAQSLYITPSALSRLIQNQERELGVRLFDRAGKSFLPTQAGEAYVRWGKQMLHMQASMEEELRRISRGNEGKIRLGFPMVLSSVVTEEIIPVFRKQYPHVELVLAESATASLERQLEEYQLDFAIITAERFLDSMIYEPLLEEQIVLAVPAGHPLLEKGQKREGMDYPYIDIREFGDETFIVLYPDQSLRRYSEKVFKTYDISPYVPIQVHTVDTSLRCVKNGLGVTITYDRPVLGEHYRGKIVPVCFEEHTGRWPMCLVRHRDHELTRSMEALRRVCEEVLQKR